MNVQNPSASRGIAIQAVDLVKNYGTGSNMVLSLIHISEPTRQEAHARRSRLRHFRPYLVRRRRPDPHG